MPTVYRLNYRPDLDLNWDVNPGNCQSMAGFAHDEYGDLNTVDVLSSFGSFAITGDDALHAEVFAGPTGAARFLVFRKGDIDEYTNAGTRTNRATGLSASTESWEAASWGSQIIAVNYLNSPQSSTGGGFSALSGSPPKARHIAANVNFVLMADVDDGGSNIYADMVWWSGIRNPATWTPNQATQAGRVRLLDTPGPIMRVVAFGDKFLVFKQDSVYLGRYIGPPYVFDWKVINDNVGCSYPRAVALVDGRVYFGHRTGIYAFDGQQFENVGLGVFGSINGDMAVNDTYYMHMYGDGLGGNVWVASNLQTVATFTQNHLYSHCYNARSRLWSRQGKVCSSSDAANASFPLMVAGEKNEHYNFWTQWGYANGFVHLNNGNSPVVGSLVTRGNTQAGFTASLITGYIGNTDVSNHASSVYVRGVVGTSPGVTVTLSGYNNDQNSTVVGYGTAATSWNRERCTFDGLLDAKFKTVTVTLADGESWALQGLGVTATQTGLR